MSSNTSSSPSIPADSQIAFIGGGNMAASIIGGLIAAGVSAAQIRVADPIQESLERLKATAPVMTSSDNAEAVAGADVIVMAVKPQVMRTVAEALAPSLLNSGALVISIAAGITAGSLSQWLGKHLAIVRCMPNTPALLQCGATALYANANTSTEQRDLADAVLAAVGINRWVEEEGQLDAVTALSGSGPAYFFLAMEAMQAAGEKLGLDADTARDLTLQTALGAARMVCESDVDAAELRRRVTSPNGTTERAVNLFQQGGFEALFETAMTGARDRSIELAEELGD